MELTAFLLLSKAIRENRCYVLVLLDYIFNLVRINHIYLQNIFLTLFVINHIYLQKL